MKLSMQLIRFWAKNDGDAAPTTHGSEALLQLPVSRAGSNGRCNTHRIGSIHNAFEEGPTCRGDLQLDLKQGSFL